MQRKGLKKPFAINKKSVPVIAAKAAPIRLDRGILQKNTLYRVWKSQNQKLVLEMKNLIYLLIILPLLSCSEDESPKGSIAVHVEYEYENGVNDTYPVAAKLPVFIFEDVNISTGNYTYTGAGKLRNEDNGEIINSIQTKNLELGRAKFEGLQVKNYAVVLDMLNTKVKDFTATSMEKESCHLR